MLHERSGVNAEDEFGIAHEVKSSAKSKKVGAVSTGVSRRHAGGEA
jgi:hypothetical protein